MKSAYVAGRGDSPRERLDRLARYRVHGAGRDFRQGRQYKSPFAESGMGECQFGGFERSIGPQDDIDIDFPRPPSLPRFPAQMAFNKFRHIQEFKRPEGRLDLCGSVQERRLIQLADRVGFVETGTPLQRDPFPDVQRLQSLVQVRFAAAYVAPQSKVYTGMTGVTLFISHLLIIPHRISGFQG